MTFNGRHPPIEDDPKSKTVANERPMVEDNLLWKMTSSGKFTLISILATFHAC